MPDAAPETNPPAAANGAPPPAANAAPTEPAADSKEGRFYAAQRAREAKLVKDQQTFARTRDEFERYKTQTTQELTKSQQAAALAAADPVRYLKEVHGWDEDRVAARIMSGGKPTLMDRDAERDRELKELRDWKASQEQAAQGQKRESQMTAAREEFHKTSQDGARWPLASQWKRDRLVARGEAIALEHAHQGVQLSDEDILDKLEEELGEIASIKRTSTTATSNAGSPAPQAQTGTDTKPAPTLTSGGAAEVAATSEVDILKMSPQELRDYTLRILKEGRAKGLIVD